MFERLVEIICNYVEVEPENVKPESRFMEDLGFTSFDFIRRLARSLINHRHRIVF